MVFYSRLHENHRWRLSTRLLLRISHCITLLILQVLDETVSLETIAILSFFTLVRKDQATILCNVQVLANIPLSKRNNTDFSPFYSQKECQIHATKSQFVSEHGLCVLPISHPNSVTADLICCTLVAAQNLLWETTGKLRQCFVYRKCSYCPLHAAAGMHHAREKTPKHRLSCDESASHCKNSYGLSKNLFFG